MKNNAKIPDISTLIQAGINPKTGLPIKLDNINDSCLKSDLKRIIKLIDRQDALKKYEWFNLPSGLDGELIERMLYYKGSAALFYMPTNNTFYFLPYALDGNIDVYGRYLGITPLPFAGPTSTTDQQGKQKAWIEGLVKKPVYEVLLPWEVNKDVYDNSAVILRDYSNGIAQTITPRNDLNDSLCDIEAEMLPYMRTALMGLSGVAGMRVSSEEEQSNVIAASKSVKNAALSGDKWVPVIGNLDFQSFDTSNVSNVQEFSLAMATIDNLRLSTHGLDNGGLFEKQAHLLQSEANAGSVNTGLILQDGLTLRQNFCTIANSIWGLNMWCDTRQPAMLMPSNDMNADLTGGYYQGEPHEGGSQQDEQQ